MNHSTDGNGNNAAPTGEVYPLPVHLKTVTAGVATEISGTNPLPTQGREGYEATVTWTRPNDTNTYTAGDALGCDAGTSQVETATVVGTITPGTSQLETATVVGTITAPVLQVETATAVGTITAGTAQVETATCVGTITGDGTAQVIVTGALIPGSPIIANVAVANTDVDTAWAAKVRTALAVFDAITDFYTVGGTGAEVTLTALTPAANDATLNIAIDNGTCTGITAAPTSANTTAGVAPGTGNASVTLTGIGFLVSPITLNVAVVASDNAATWAGKVRTAIDTYVNTGTPLYTVGGSGVEITLTLINATANDGTLNIALANGTCTGITAAPTSVDTTAGVASGTGNAAVTVTGAGITGSPLLTNVAVTASDNASAVAGKIRTALGAVGAITAIYTVGGTGADVTLTKTTPAANDATLNIAIANGTCTGLTAAPTSADTTAGVAPGTGNAAVTITSAALTGSPLTVAVPVVASDDANAVAGKIRTALGANAAVAAVFTVGGATNAVILTKTVPAANDATLNIAIANGTCTGLTAAPTSANTTAGSLTSTNAGTAIFELVNIGPAGGHIMITDTPMEIDANALPSGMAGFRFHFFNAAPSAIMDNAAFDVATSGDREKYLGYVEGDVPVDLGSTLYANNAQRNKKVKLATGSTSLWMVTTPTVGYTPTASVVKKVTVEAVAV